MSVEEKTASLSIKDNVYVSAAGKDEPSLGSKESPYATPAFAIFDSRTENILVQNSEGEYEPISPSALKKARKGADGLAKKQEKAKQQAEAAAARQAEAAAKLEAAKQIKIVDDESLPKATRSRIGDLEHLRGQRVLVNGWVHRMRQQKDMCFIVLRDGSGFLQVILSGDLARSHAALTLTMESTITVKGTLKAVPEGQTAPGGHELPADYFEVVGLAPSGEAAYTNIVTEQADPSLMFDNRHLALRGDALSSVMKVRAALLRALRETSREQKLTEVTPPCIVQSMVEGGATLFDLKYYGDDAYLTQSSQLYLETCIPSLGDVFCIQESFRAERSHTRRHLSEFTHFEAELGFLSFEDMLTHIESMVVGMVDKVLEDPVAGPIVKQLNPNFVKPSTPFLRMEYKDALEWLNEHDIPNEEGEKFKFGDDIAEAAERRMTDEINRPILLTKFPVEIKSFYMARCQDDPRVTESVDVLMPNVGEVTGGSMRISDLDELMAAFKRENIDPSPYYWFIDLRKYGTFPHGGYGLGTERILAWLCDRYTVRDCSLYPRFTGRCAP